MKEYLVTHIFNYPEKKIYKTMKLFFISLFFLIFKHYYVIKDHFMQS